MAQDQFAQGSLDGGHRADSPPSTSAYFRYSPTGSYIVHIYGRRVARDRRLRHERTRWMAGLLSMSCFALLLSGSMWMLLSLYSSENVEMGRNYSRVYRANPLFVKSISVTNLLENEGPVVYGFSKTPELGKETDWDEAHNAVVPSNEHVEWAFWLNRGSQVTIQYNISDPDLDVLLVVIRGRENMEKWREDSTNFGLAVLWKAIHEVGSFQYKVETDQNYYFGLGNMQSLDVQVNLQFSLQSKVHNTESHTSQCCPTSSTCTVHLKLFGSDVLLLTTPHTDQNLDRRGGARILQQDDGGWTMNVGFEQRWITYLFFCGAMAIVMLVLLVCCRPPSSSGSEASQENQEPTIETTHILNSTEEAEKQVNFEHLEASSTNLLADFDDDTSDIMEEYMCIICFEARRNCFFDPCGHCATCYACSMKILKQKSMCPLCRQPIRLVRRLFLR